ncbi:MAG: hypothetical protein JWM95_1638, partial [Gemmatimonadetes bacterium]|nr:hypothetical protein [Gemmatimonadota bacterium]
QNVPNSMRWKGLLYDAESGLYYVRARYYAPEMRRFLSEDPIGLAGGINQYRFAENDPVNGSDPTGLDSNNDEDCTFSNYVLVCTPWINGPPPGAGIGLIEVAPVPSWDSPTPQSSFRGGPQATNPHAPIKYSAVVCPGFLATGPLRNGLEALYRLQTTTEQASVFQALPGGAIKQIVLTNPNSSSVAQTQLPGLLPVGTFTINHTHPKGPSFLQGPSRGDSIAAARTAMVALIIAPDSLFWMNPGGKSYGCAR